MPFWHLTPTTAKDGNISFRSQCNNADSKADPPFQSSYETHMQKEATRNVVMEGEDEHHKREEQSVPRFLLGLRSLKSPRGPAAGER